MPFTIPNHADAFHAFQASPDSVDFDILTAAFQGEGVVAGCAVTSNSNMTLAVASGVVAVDGARATVTGANVTVGTADTSNARIDLVTVNSSGTLAVTAGTAAAVPQLPDIPSTSVVLAAVYIPVDDTVLATNQITDKRVFINNAAAPGLADDNILVLLGTDGDAAIVLNSAGLAADAELTGVIEGTSDTLAVAANSLLFGNVTNDGDVAIYVSKAGNSHMAFLADGSTGDTILMAASGQSVDMYIAGTKEMDFTASGIDLVTGNDYQINSTSVLNATTLGSAVVNSSLTSFGVLASPVMTTPQINDTSADHQYIFAGSELAADRTVTLPLLTGNDTFVFEAHAQTFTNKTFDANGTGNVLSNVDIADLAAGTDGELITWDAAGVAATVAVGTATHVLTSNGAGVAPTFQVAAAT
ncbi:MAG: hypothetical protein U9R65_18940, partial [Pseudomonadota bacterium]|nr:hypothetical protein [Pseudomonadota bacterium]